MYNQQQGRGGYDRGGYNNQNQGQPAKRKSGARFGHDKNGKPYVSGWKVSRRTGMISFLCVPTSNTGTHRSKSGNEWENWMVKVEFKDEYRQETVSGLYNPKNHTVHITDWGLIIKPSTPGGGWVGDPKQAERSIQRQQRGR